MPKAIDCFLKQTYPYRELLIVATGADVSDLVPPHQNIRLLPVGFVPSIGEARNFGCAHASGELIAHWDDDDYSAPERLTDQVERLEQSGKSVTGYHSMRFTDGSGKWLWYQSGDLLHFAMGTSLVYRRSWWHEHRFQPINVGEDNHFVREAAWAHQLITTNAQDLMYATIHPLNTSPRQTQGHNWRIISDPNEKERLALWQQ